MFSGKFQIILKIFIRLTIGIVCNLYKNDFIQAFNGLDLIIQLHLGFFFCLFSYFSIRYVFILKKDFILKIIKFLNKYKNILLKILIIFIFIFLYVFFLDFNFCFSEEEEEKSKRYALIGLGIVGGTIGLCIGYSIYRCIKDTNELYRLRDRYYKNTDIETLYRNHEKIMIHRDVITTPYLNHAYDRWTLDHTDYTFVVRVLESKFLYDNRYLAYMEDIRRNYWVRTSIFAGRDFSEIPTYLHHSWVTNTLRKEFPISIMALSEGCSSDKFAKKISDLISAQNEILRPDNFTPYTLNKVHSYMVGIFPSRLNYLYSFMRRMGYHKIDFIRYQGMLQIYQHADTVLDFSLNKSNLICYDLSTCFLYGLFKVFSLVHFCPNPIPFEDTLNAWTRIINLWDSQYINERIFSDLKEEYKRFVKVSTMLRDCANPYGSLEYRTNWRAFVYIQDPANIDSDINLEYWEDKHMEDEKKRINHLYSLILKSTKHSWYKGR